MGVVLSLFLKPLKCKTYFALFSTFFFLVGSWCLFLSILSWFPNGVYSLAIFTDSGLLSLTFFGWRKGEVGGSHSAPIHPTSLVPGHQPESRTVHHHHQSHSSPHGQTVVRQDSFRFRVAYRFVCLFLDSNNHSTYYCSSLQFDIHTYHSAILSSFFVFDFPVFK